MHFVFLKMLLFNSQLNTLCAQYNLWPHLQLEKCFRWKKKMQGRRRSGLICGGASGGGLWSLQSLFFFPLFILPLIPPCTHTHTPAALSSTFSRAPKKKLYQFLPGEGQRSFVAALTSRRRGRGQNSLWSRSNQRGLRNWNRWTRLKALQPPHLYS